jgi:transcriptional regulator of acetoin/glycerol metabolism
VALARGSRIELEDLPEEVRQAATASIPSEGRLRPLAEIEREYILAALQINKRNQTQTARDLGIGSATLYRKLKVYGLTAKSG